jgi:hypothetical protein
MIGGNAEIALQIGEESIAKKGMNRKITFPKTDRPPGG